MKTIIFAAALAFSASAFATEWEIDSAHAAANFSVKHLGVTNVNGTLGPVTGKLVIDDKDITKSSLTATIDVKGVNTGVAKRDEHLRGPDFFDAEKNPVTFKSTKFEKVSDTKFKITGDLTMRGVAKPVTFEAELSPEVDHPFAPNTKARGASASLTLDREVWGLTWNKPLANNGFLVGKEVKVGLEIELGRKVEAPKAAPAKK